MIQNSEPCAKVIHHMTHKCESWKHYKSHTYEIQTPMTHNRESYETLSSLSQIRDISSSLPLGESLRLFPKVRRPSAYPSHFLPEAACLALCEPILSSYRFQQVP